MSEFDEILKSKLDSYTETPSVEVFQNIRRNYPAKSFTEFVRYNKYYFIAGISAVIITGIILLVLPQKSNLQDNPTKKDLVIVDNNTNIGTSNTVNNNLDLNNYSGNELNNVLLTDNKVETQTENSLKEVSNFNIFKSNDTLICGREFEFNYNGAASNFIIPSGVKMIVKEQSINFICVQPGKYNIIYSEISDKKILTDTISVLYNNVSSADVKLSSEVLCPGENLTLSIANNNNIPQWKNSNLLVQKSGSGIYNISQLKPGKNVISFTIGDKNCQTGYEKTVDVLQKIDYSYASSSAICSQADATLIINTKNQKADSYILNNYIFSKSGKFENLNSGIYSLTINYGEKCQLRDTILVRDSLNINPYFISERDLLTKNKYYFRNLSKIDDKGYESNSSVRFVWKINGSEIVSGDNAEFEFSTNGNNLVELIAILNEGCQSIYSETIYISSSNFRIPNIFTPNGDGIGDEFKVLYDGELSNYKVSIINRLGEVVFESAKITHSWDGKINGDDDASEGLYYYIIRGEDNSGNKIEQKGSLQLVRY